MGATFLCLAAFFAVCAATEVHCATVKTLNGSYVGVHLPHYKQDVFLGMPYAQGRTSGQWHCRCSLTFDGQDTGGRNRFRVPQALDEAWTGTRAAFKYGPACPDYDPADDEHGMSENCLTINIVRPEGVKCDARLPVAFWIHGGS